MTRTITTRSRTPPRENRQGNEACRTRVTGRGESRRSAGRKTVVEDSRRLAPTDSLLLVIEVAGQRRHPPVERTRSVFGLSDLFLCRDGATHFGIDLCVK